MTQISSSPEHDSEDSQVVDYERMMESFLLIGVNSDSEGDYIPPMEQKIEEQEVSILDIDEFTILPVKSVTDDEVKQPELTESLFETEQKESSGNALHMSRYFPNLVQRIHKQVEDGMEHQTYDEDWSIFKAAPESTFILPDLSTISEEMKAFIRKDLFQTSHLITLESRKIINWSDEISTLIPLHTQGDGNCLMHAVSLGMFGIHDRQLVLRKALYRALTGYSGELFKARWLVQASKINRGSKINEESLEREWETIVKESSPEPVNNTSERSTFQYLGQMHVFVLAHILRRPIIVYAECKARDIATDQTIFELPSDERIDGIYLPLLLPKELTRGDPLVLAFHSSHFAPLVATLPDFKLDSELFEGYSAYYPLVDYNKTPLPVHYLDESRNEQGSLILPNWLNVSETSSGIYVAEQLHLERPTVHIALLKEYLKGIEPKLKLQSNPQIAYMGPCKSSCGFTGNNATEGYCSVCYKKLKNSTSKLCAGNCGYYAGEGGYCSSCDKKHLRTTPITYSPDVIPAFQNFTDLLQPYTNLRNYPSTNSLSNCRTFGCIYTGTQNGYCSVCYERNFN